MLENAVNGLTRSRYVIGRVLNTPVAVPPIFAKPPANPQLPL